ncbi:adenosine kinase [Paremcibacter congregatus]|uniref:Adenosine kinase n=1 Tax=Paremcibacter congregatus TaxID=2043170 RepID=A0A2G4YRQ6_9PROT|nr:adenosine kinase [Paremcibacter congregatus]PHZ85034.1 adenosine kinase [Paremcibacter congregatus]QDE25991.1 adenosine kinase [Paremcibacter congregatus]
MTSKFDVLGIGNAIVDVLVHIEDSFLAEHDIPRGSMQLVDEATSERLYGQLGQAIECSGGSAANTIAGLASLGSKSAYIGKTKDDQLGHVFDHDIKSLGIEFSTTKDTSGVSTARCLVMVSPDAERTMCTYLGACVNLTEDDIDPDLVAASSVTYMEGYLWDPEQAKAAFRKAMTLSHAAGRKTSLSLSDSFCVGRHKAEFLQLAEHEIDILFANEDELLMLYDTQDISVALAAVQQHCDIAAITRSAKGCVIASPTEIIEVPGRSVDRLVDTTGAGDLFAAGFLHGYTRGEDLATCGNMGNLTASEVITHMGARPDVILKDYMRDHL